MIKYRTREGSADYQFSFERQSDGNIRAYIEDMPSYGVRDTRLSTTHRLTDGGRPYVCWTGRLETEEDVKDVASLWADLTEKYIRTGQTIDSQVAEAQRTGQWPPPRAWDRFARSDGQSRSSGQRQERKSWLARLLG